MTAAHPTSSPSPGPGADDTQAILVRGQAVLRAESDAILAASAKLDARFASAVRLVLQCKGRVCVTGVGKAGLIGAKLQATLASTGTYAYALHPVEALHGDLGMIHPDDVILGLSKSGSGELVELLPRLRALGCRVILLTARMDAPAARHADVVLDIGQVAEACPLGLAPSSSTAAMLALGDALALTVMELKDVQPEQYARYHPGGALGRYLMKAGELMRTGADCPTVGAQATLHACYEAILAAPRRAGAAAAVDEQGRLVGILTHGDFFRLFSKGHYDPHAAVELVMTRSPKHVAESARVVDALQLMHRYAIDELPVVDDAGRLVGIIDVQDVLARGFSLSEQG